MRSIRLLAAMVLGLSVGCAHDMHVRMPDTDPTLSGAIDIVFTRPATQVMVVIDGELVVRDEHTQRVHVGSVLAGTRDLMVVAGSGEGRVERYQHVDVDVGHTTTVPVAAPGQSMATDLGSTLAMIVLGIGVRLAYLALF